MSAQAMGWALDQDLPARPKLVLVAIANHADHTDGYCWLKAETIAAEASCTPRSVFRFIGGLVRNGFIRKAQKRGEDGKQRANNYWMLFNREPAKWDWGAGLGHEEAEELPENDAIEGEESDAETHGSSDAELQDVVESPAAEKHVLSYGPHDSHDTRADENTPVLSHGPYDSRVSHKRIAEPSKTNPLEPLVRGAAPRTYRPPPPPPPQPVGSVVGRQGELVFVFKPSRGYDAWKLEKERLSGHPFNAEMWREGRLGWFFPSLFPPERPPPSGTSLASDSELDQFAKTG